MPCDVALRREENNPVIKTFQSWYCAAPTEFRIARAITWVRFTRNWINIICQANEEQLREARAWLLREIERGVHE